ncbi:hypothetical protein AKJ66_02450 [candidate division MSBL1 archaeon SCGC-AAA259E22]|uniref:Uncharacterized protein n=1 Tax=candidate division MSBL1 archaeon SCGC-AAA259E22 TaxID=1698265 RepID=A0A133UGF0_9EURY|nr:hypothetical protein AKJ66_02450 [candidate division MSBL1 archaeon SCGC-AAA259E22]
MRFDVLENKELVKKIHQALGQKITPLGMTFYITEVRNRREELRRLFFVMFGPMKDFTRK